MNDQDKRAVEGLARSGIDLDGFCDAFPKFPREDIVKIYDYIYLAAARESFVSAYEDHRTDCFSDIRLSDRPRLFTYKGSEKVYKEIAFDRCYNRTDL